VWKDTSEGNGGTDKCVELFVAADGKLEMAGRDSLDFEVLRGVLEMDVSMAAILGVLGINGRLTPASSRTSAVKYSSTAVTYTAALAPTRILFCVFCFRKRLTRPQGN
jgi:hypothetical protein